MITSINLKNVATFDTTNGTPIIDLKKVNFFFGFNGTGKSTIAKYLRNISLDIPYQDPSFSHCANAGFNNTQHHILAFCDEFIEENFKKSPDFKGVFSLNQSNATIDQQITIEEAKIQKFENLRDKYIKRNKDLVVDQKTELDLLLNNCWNQRTSFAAFTKISLVHSGSKPNHLQEIRRTLQRPIISVLSMDELTNRYRTLYENELKEIVLKVDEKIYFEIRRLEGKITKLLKEVIVGNEDVDIAGLIKTLKSRGWVEIGVKYLKTTNNTCPFCQKETIDADLIDQFNKYFDETYKEKIGELGTLRDSYKNKSVEFINIITAIQNVFNPNNIVSNLLITLTSLFENNVETINYKLKHSNEKKILVSLNTKKGELSDIMRRIGENNKIYSESDTSKNNLNSEIWKYISDNSSQAIQEYDNKVMKYSRLNTLSNELKDRCETNISTSKQNIETLRSQTVNTKAAVDNINLILKNAGFEGFEIAEKDKVNNISRYYLKRLNSTSTDPIFSSLSEGEKNFISFLYFYELCLGTDDLQSKGSKKKIIVIDDPVSSLDSQSLFIVSTLIHTLIQRKSDNKPDRMLLKNNNIAQVFILTHNLYFYKEVSLDKRPICTDYWHYKISKQNNQTIITGAYNKSVFDDYTLMWQTIKSVKSNIPQNSSYNIMISNSMRRIIESYVNFIGYGKDSWSALLNENQADSSYYIKCSFISTINDESHKITALDSAYYQKIITEQPQILFNVFASIFKSIGKEHYEMMMDEQLVP